MNNNAPIGLNLTDMGGDTGTQAGKSHSVLNNEKMYKPGKKYRSATVRTTARFIEVGEARLLT